MVMKRIRAGSGSGMQIIRSASRHRAKNVDMAARAVETTHANFNPEGINPLNGRPRPVDPFAGAPEQRPKENAAEAASSALQRFGEGAAAAFGLTKGAGGFGFGRGANIPVRMGDALQGPNGQRLIPKEVYRQRMLKDKK